MASIGGVSSSNSMSSLMRSANMISGLASGLDTESMIENLVKGYQTKIQQINQKITKTEWKQEAYRSIIQKMVGISNKYTSYSTGSTNLMSPSFFNNSVKIETNGKYKDLVTATGKSGSDISLDAVKQLATAAQYRTSGNLNHGDNQNIDGSSVDLTDPDAFKLSSLNGSLSLKYGSKTVSISFNEVDDAKALQEIKDKFKADPENAGKEMSEAEALATLMNNKLKGQQITFNGGNVESADKRIQFEASEDGKSINIKELGTAGNGVSISGASGNVKSKLGLSDDALKEIKDKPITSFNMSGVLDSDGNLVRNLSSFEYLAEKGKTSMNLTLDGVTKQIALPEVKMVKKDSGNEYYINGEQVDEDKLADVYTKALNDEVQKQFKGGKIEVTNQGENGELKLNFNLKDEGSNLVVNTDVGDALGIGRTATSYLNTSKTLGDLVDLKDEDALKDKDGNFVLDDKGNKQYKFELNGVTIGTYTKESKLSDVMNDINSNKEANVSVSYSKATNNFTFTSKETGLDSEVTMGEGLAESMFGSTKVADAGERKFTDSYLVAGMQGGTANVSIQVDGHATKHNISITENTTMKDVVDSLNSGQYADRYTFQYNEYSGKIEAKDRDTGKLVNLDMTSKKQDGTETAVRFDKNNAPSLDYTAGQDAKFTITVNGETKEMTRSSNTVDIDGMSITMKGTFSAASNDEKVTFSSKTDSDKIINAIKDFAKDYNEMMAEIKKTYGTMPYQKSDGSLGGYQPLTDEDKEGMTESAIKNYEEKAKQGILFGDQTLSTLYDKMSEVFSFSNTEDVDALKDAGISLTYDISTGTQSLEIDEEKLRAVLDSDPDRIANVFTKTDGVMDRMKTQLDAYAKTTGEPKGILIQQAGSPLSSLSLLNNQWQSEIDNYNTQIEKWQDKLTSQVDRYTQQFSRLELLINQMNSQSSTLAGMMGG